MNYKILFNPKSNRGKTDKNIKKLQNKLLKEGHNVEVSSLLDIKSADDYIKSINEDDKIIIFGGDGTLHYLANELMGHKYKQEIFVASKAGTGNDFVRSLRQKTFLIKINDYINDLPYVSEKDNKRYFINSVGFGLDALVCKYVADKKSKTEGSYFKSTLKAIKSYNSFELTTTIDGVSKTFPKTWFAVVCNSKYFGGGMKISPKSIRLDDKLEVVVINRVPRWLILLIFPTIYLGLHKIFKRWVHFYQGSEISFQADKDLFVEFDGELAEPKSLLTIKR